MATWDEDLEVWRCDEAPDPTTFADGDRIVYGEWDFPWRRATDRDGRVGWLPDWNAFGDRTLDDIAEQSDARTWTSAGGEERCTELVRVGRAVYSQGWDEGAEFCRFLAPGEELELSVALPDDVDEDDEDAWTADAHRWSPDDAPADAD